MKRVLIGVLSTAAIAIGTEAAAQAYPTKPIRLMMPNAPGSSNDTLARILATHFGEAIGQQLVVDNRAGAGGIVGMEIGKNGVPDGYTLVAASTAAMSIAPHLHHRLPYDPLKDFEYIGMFGVTPNVLVVNPQQPVKTMKDWLEWTRSRGTQLNMASAGTGAQSHLTGIALIVAAGVQSTHVPYKGGGASVAAVVAGESHWTITPAPAVMGQVNSRRGLIQGMEVRLGNAQAVKAMVPLAEMFGYATQLRSATQGRGVFNMEFDHYAPVSQSVAEEILKG